MRWGAIKLAASCAKLVVCFDAGSVSRRSPIVGMIIGFLRTFWNVVLTLRGRIGFGALISPSLWTAEGWLYMAVVIDLFSRRVVGWSLADHMRTELTENALMMAWWRRQPQNGLIHHSDHGSQYASDYFQDLLAQFGMESSMSRKGGCWDNAVVECFFGSLKRERTDHCLLATRQEARQAVIDYIEMFFNSRRLHSCLGCKSPLEYEEMAKWLSKLIAQYV